MTTERNDLQDIIDNALEDMAREVGGDFDANTSIVASEMSTSATAMLANTILNGCHARLLFVRLLQIRA